MWGVVLIFKKKMKAKIYENDVKIDSIMFDTVDELKDKMKEKNL